MDPAIRPERASDRAAIRALVAAAFPTPAEAQLVDALRDAGDLALSLVAERDGALVGHVAFSPIAVDEERGAPRAQPLGLAPLAVDASARRAGIGAALVEAGLAACAARGCPFVVVLGDPRYYARFGFAPAYARGLVDAYGGGDAFQVIELVPGALPSRGGRVGYADAFGALES